MAFTRPTKSLNPAFIASLLETLRLFPPLTSRDRVQLVLLGLGRGVQRHVLSGWCPPKDLYASFRVAAEALVDLLWERPDCRASIAFDLRTVAVHSLLGDFAAWSWLVETAWARREVGEPNDERLDLILDLRVPIFLYASPRDSEQLRRAARYALDRLKQPCDGVEDEIRALREAHYYLIHERKNPDPGIYFDNGRARVGKRQIRDAIESVRHLPRTRRRVRDEQRPKTRQRIPFELLEGDKPMYAVESREAADAMTRVAALDEIEEARQHLERRKAQATRGSDRWLVVDHLLRVTDGSDETLTDVEQASGRAYNGLHEALKDEQRRLKEAVPSFSRFW